MFKLYATKDTPTLLDVSPNEYEIFDTLTDYISEDPTNRFLIKKRENNTDDIYRCIWSMDDYLDYREDLELRRKSCVELKQEIVNIAKPKVKTLRRR